MAGPYIGAPIRRREDIRFITGAGTYVDDIKLPHMVHAAILRSPHAHARILNIDTKRAEALPGVVSVFTLKDIGELDATVPIRMYKIPGLDKYLQPSLARDVVRYVGEPVAVAVAESRYLAEDALDAIDVDYEILQEVMDVREALQDKVLVHEHNGTNLAGVHHVSIGDADKAFAEAEYTRREEFRVHRFTGNPMETRGTVAHFDRGKGELRVYGATKLPHLNRQTIAAFLQMPEHKCHFEENDVGGGFGIRGELYPEDFLIPFASVRLGVPVKWIEDRREHLLAANHSRQVTCELEIAARKDGTLLAVRAQIYGDMGAYVRTHGGLVPCSTAALLTGPYRIPNYEAKIHCVMTNKTGMGTLRAPGRVESCFYRERMLDMMARDLDLDPVELRRKNLVQPSEIPYEVGQTRPSAHPTILDSGDYPSALRQALERFKYDEMQGLQGFREDGRYHGIGLSYFVKNTGGLEPYEGARMVVGEGGGVSVYLSIAQLGQGHETAMAQICADALCVPMDAISVFHGNTDLSPFGWGTFASRGTVMAGNAVHLTALQLKDKILEAAARHLDVDAAKLALEDGEIVQPGTEAPALPLGELVSAHAGVHHPRAGRPRTRDHRLLQLQQHHPHLRRAPGPRGRGPRNRHAGGAQVPGGGGRGPGGQPPHGARPDRGRRGAGHRRRGARRARVRRGRPAPHHHVPGLPAAHQHRRPPHRRPRAGGGPLTLQPAGRQGRRRRRHRRHRRRPGQRRQQRPRHRGQGPAPQPRPHPLLDPRPRRRLARNRTVVPRRSD